MEAYCFLIKDNTTSQEELQDLMPTKQSSAYEESQRTLFIGNTR